MRSGFEEEIKQQLIKAKVPFGYENTKVPYSVPAKEVNYIPDFILGKNSAKKLLTLKDLDGKLLIETKGNFTLADRRKMLWVKERHPYLDIRIVLQSDNYLTKLTARQKKLKKENKPFKKLRYSDWCKENGFPFAIRVIPKEWLK